MPISDARLHQRGISTLLIDTGTHVRYVHPAEAALLQGAAIRKTIMDTLQPGDLKLLLTQLGQLASPIHSANFTAKLLAGIYDLPTPMDLRRKITAHVMQAWYDTCATCEAKFRQGTALPPLTPVAEWALGPTPKALPHQNQPEEPARQHQNTNSRTSQSKWNPALRHQSNTESSSTVSTPMKPPTPAGSSCKQAQRSQTCEPGRPRCQP